MWLDNVDVIRYSHTNSNIPHAVARAEHHGRIGWVQDRDTMIDETDKQVIALIQGDLPLTPTPFAVMAQKVGISEEAFLGRVERLRRRGILRRFGATLRHQEAGFSSNAMVAWVVPDDRINEVGETLAQFREVTHCYQRRPQKDWCYNVYTMIHGNSRDECRRIAEGMSRAAGVHEYTLLFSEKEFKKTSMEYF